MEPPMSPIMENTLGSTAQGRTFAFDKFKFDLESLVQFIFPKNLQHPLAASRLFVFALCGPLDENLRIRSGYQGKRVVAEYELEEMCVQLEREDIIQVYLHKPSDMGLLTSKEQEAIISQADAHLKRAKGKAMLPRLYRNDIYELFKDLPRDEWGRVSFHDAQNLILKYRGDRIKEFKLVYPSIKTKTADKEGTTSTFKLPAIGTESNFNGEGGIDLNNTTGTESSNFGQTEKKKRKKRLARVGESVAPPTMFQRNKGLTNPDIIEQTTNYLSKHAFKISDIDQAATSSVISNIKLLREVPPYCKNPYSTEGPSAREQWNDNSTMTGVGLGSMVQASSSSSTWKRKVTVY
jgi:hypothetical protein